MRDNIKKLLASKVVSNYKISKDTKIARMTLSDYATGKSNIGNMKLDHADTLNKYYEEEIMIKELGINLEEITKAKDEFNSWSGTATLFIDFEDGETWTSVEDIPTYRSKNIYSIVSKDTMFGPN